MHHTEAGPERLKETGDISTDQDSSASAVLAAAIIRQFPEVSTYRIVVEDFNKNESDDTLEDDYFDIPLSRDVKRANQRHVSSLSSVASKIDALIHNIATSAVLEDVSEEELPQYIGMFNSIFTIEIKESGISDERKINFTKETIATDFEEVILGTYRFFKHTVGLILDLQQKYAQLPEGEQKYLATSVLIATAEMLAFRERKRTEMSNDESTMYDFLSMAIAPRGKTKNIKDLPAVNHLHEALSKLRSGDLDDHLRQHYVNGYTTGDTFQRHNLKDTMNFIAAIAGEEHSGHKFTPSTLRLLEIHDAWPSALSSEFANYKSILASRATKVMQNAIARSAIPRYRHDSKQQMEMLSLLVCETVIEQINRLAQRQSGGVGNVTSINRVATKHAKARIHSRIKQLEASEDRHDPLAELLLRDTVVIEEIKLRERSLMSCVAIGRRTFAVKGPITDESDPFKEFAASHKGAIGIESDMQKIREYLQKLQLGDSHKIGVKQTQNDRRIIIEDEQVPLYEFKPTEVPGLSIQSKQVKQCRVLFAFRGDEEIVILRVLDRDKLEVFFKSAGIGK